MNDPSFEPAVAPPAVASNDGLLLAFCDRKLLTLDAERATSVVPTVGEIGTLVLSQRLILSRQLFLGRLDGREVHAAEVTVQGALGTLGDAGQQFGAVPLVLHTLRGLFGRLPDHLFWLAGRAIQFLEWDRDHQFCGRCGVPTEARSEERSRVCPGCSLAHYPRLAPAVIVLVHDGDRLLLARSPHFPPGMYSTLAGFVEPGEQLEDTVTREIREEVGITVRDVCYFGSQPWPFPHSLMIGFTAAYNGGELAFGGDGDGEIEDAAWFSMDQLPLIPPRISIARALIDGFWKDGFRKDGFS